MRYRRVLATRKGPPEVLEIIEDEIRPPAAGEVRVRVLCAGVGFTDVVARYGRYIYGPPLPFVPGYEIVGVVDALGDGVTGLAVGQRVAALTGHGGWAEYVWLPAAELVPVPDGLDPAEVACLVLNYVTAHQMLHRVAHVEPGQKIVLTAAAGGIGTALLQLGRAAGLAAMYGVSSTRKHAVIEAEGGVPIDYREQDFVAAIRAREPNGVDAVFDAIGGPWVNRCHRLTRRGGITVIYGNNANPARRSFTITGYGTFLRIGLLWARPDGKRSTFYGITRLYRKDPRPFREDLAALFALLAAGTIRPRIAGRWPLADARRANEAVERGEVDGKLVLVCADA